MELKTYLEERIAENKAKLSDASTKNDESATAKLAFYTSLEHVLKKEATKSDIATLDAINDVLQRLGLVPGDKTFYKM